MVMFPFIFKLWRYHGLPTPEEVPDVVRKDPAQAVAPAASTHVSHAAEGRLQGELRRIWEQSYRVRPPLSRRPEAGAGPRRILAVDDGSENFRDALAAARFLSERWKALPAESPMMGSAADVLTYARREGADWLVVGVSQISDVERVRVGSFAEELIKAADRPVLAVPRGTLARGVRRILVPVDETTASLASVAEALRWARLFASELLILHVDDQGGAGETEHEAFLKILEDVRWQSTRHETLQGKGTVAEAILACARDHAADLILMGTHREAIEGEILPQSRAVAVLRGAATPVMIMHPYRE